MDIKEVKEFLESNADGKKLLSEMVEEHDAIKGLKQKNADLIASNKTFKTERDNAVAEVDTVQAEFTEFKNAAKEGKADVVTKADYDKVVAERDAAVNEVTEVKGTLRNKTIGEALDGAINAANIAKDHIPAVRALLRSENKIELDEVDHVAKVNGVPINDVVAEWVQGDMGKRYVAAPVNTGGGSQGSRNTTPQQKADDGLFGKSRLAAARAQG